MEAKPRKIKVWYQAGDICSEVDQALISGLDAVGYDCGDVGSFIGSLPAFIERDMEFIRKDLEEYPEDEEVHPKPGMVWLRCTLTNYEMKEIFSMIDISIETAEGTRWRSVVPMLKGLKHKLEKGITKSRGE